jgi:hypothetical protein
MNLLKGWILLDKELLIAKNELSKISRRTNIESVRYELYSITTTILLSKVFFNKNSEIESYLNSANIHFKEYVFRSRTLVVSRVIRYIETADQEKLFELLDVTKDIIFSNEAIINKPQKNNNSIDELLNQFGRNK